jgi:hypothetical protein
MLKWRGASELMSVDFTSYYAVAAFEGPIRESLAL